MGRPLVSPVSATALSSALGLRLLGADVAVLRVAALAESSPQTLSFVKSPTLAPHAHADALMVASDGETAAILQSRGASVLLSSNPRRDFARALGVLDETAGFLWSNLPAEIHPTASIGSNVVLGPGVRIGAYTRILHNVVIGREVIIGDRCIIKSSTVIGEEGFGFERADDGSAVRLPHIGSVTIGDDVEIGSLTTVCRGTLGDTTIRRGAKIDDHVHIAHNVNVGEHAFVIACAEVSGGVDIGAEAWIAPNATVKNQVRIGAGSVIGLGAVVLKDVEDRQVIVGNPGKPLKR